MGKQINYYMNKDIENKFIKYLFEKGFYILEEDYEKKRINVYKTCSECKSSKSRQKFLYKSKYDNIKYLDNIKYRIDIIDSPIIEFNKTYMLKEKKQISRGRLWYETRYYGEDGNIIIKDEEVNRDYKDLVKWIKKNVPYKEVTNMGYNIKYYINDEIKKLVDDEEYGLI